MSILPMPDAGRAVRREVPIYSSHLDLIRGLAAVAVMIGHLKFFLGDIKKTATLGDGVVSPLARNPNQMNPAHEAVIVFFVLSGVLVGGKVLRDQRARVFSWRSYIVKRLSRLLTVLVPALVLGFVIDSGTRRMVLHSPHHLTTMLGDLSSIALDWKTFFANLCFLQTLDTTGIRPFGTNIALWSLSFEFWYYLLFPLLLGALLLRPSRRREIYCLLATLVACFMWEHPLSRFPIWLLGAFATRLPRFIPERWQRIAVALCAAQFLGCAVFLWLRPWPRFLMDDLILGSSFTMLVVAILHRRSSRTRGVYSFVAEHLSGPSYSVYLFHVPILTFIVTWIALNRPQLLGYEVVFMFVLSSIVYVICYLLYLAFEAHTGKVREAAERMLGSQRVNRIPLLGRGA